jgi:Fibronectin type III domain
MAVSMEGQVGKQGRLAGTGRRVVAAALVCVAGLQASSGDLRALRLGERSAAGVSLYVSPGGSDGSPGTSTSPLRTLGGAQKVVRTMNTDMQAGITVHLGAGTYRLDQPLQLTPEDSGTNGHDVIWTGPPSQTAVISGAEEITGWRQVDPAKNIWAASVPAGLDTRQIYVNGARATLASGTLPVALSKTQRGYTASSAAMAHWRNPQEIEFAYLRDTGLMTAPICLVASMKGRTIVMAEPCWDNLTRRAADLVGYEHPSIPAFAENAYELLDHPGQFYLDQGSHTLYYIPRAVEDMTTADVEAPALQTLVEGAGSASNPIHNIVFANLQLSYATWLQPGSPEGFAEVQSNYTITGRRGYAREGLCMLVPHGTCPYGAWTKEPGNVQLSYDQDISFVNDRFVHLGAAGLNLDNGSQNDSVERSVFTDISGCGIEIGAVNMPRAKGSSQTVGNVVADNHLYDMPAEFPGGVAILVGYAAGTNIVHNQIDHVSYAAISLGWGGWLDKASRPSVPNFSHDNRVSDNLIFDFMQVMADGGAIYTQGITGTSMATGEKITGNVIRDQLEWGYALHSDDGATYVNYLGNILYDDTYDFGSNHADFRKRAARAASVPLDPQAIEDNYWQQGYPNSSRYGVEAHGNVVISGPAQAPASIVNAAGIEPADRSILSWRPAGESVPGTPDQPTVLYAFRGKAYLTWHPSVVQGDPPITSYTITSCVASPNGRCAGPGPAPVTISSTDFERAGYAVVSGLSPGPAYRFEVSAGNGETASTPSLGSTNRTPSNKAPGKPGRPTGLNAQAGAGLVRLLWYAPKRGRAILGYKLDMSAGPTTLVGGLNRLLVSNGGGRVLDVIGGLSPHHAYRFSVRAFNPSGAGPAATVTATTQ